MSSDVKIALVMPFFGYEEMREPFLRGYLSSRNDRHFKEIGISRDNIDLFLHGKGFPTPVSKYPTFKFEGGHKGDIVRFTLDNISMPLYDYVIVMDGDGQIRYKNIFKVIKELLNGDKTFAFLCLPFWEFCY